MQKRIVRKDEQMKLIMECRQSGLSDYQWCQRQGINAGTFYNWVSKLRKSGYTIPDSNSKTEGAATVQDVVKVNLVSGNVPGPQHLTDFGKKVFDNDRFIESPRRNHRSHRRGPRR